MQKFSITEIFESGIVLINAIFDKLTEKKKGNIIKKSSIKI